MAPPLECYGYGTNHHIDNLLGSKKMSGQKDYDEYNNQIEQLHWDGGEEGAGFLLAQKGRARDVIIMRLS